MRAGDSRPEPVPPCSAAGTRSSAAFRTSVAVPRSVRCAAAAPRSGCRGSRSPPQPPQPASSYRFADLAGTRQRLIVGIVPPFLIFTLLQAALNQGRLSNPIPALTAIAVMTAITIGAVRWARVRAISGWQSLLFVSTAICTTLIGGWYLVAGSTVELAYFAAGAGGPLLSLVAFFRPPWESMVGALLATAAIIAMVTRMDPDPAVLVRSLPGVMSNLIAVVAVLAARLTIHGMGRSVLCNEELERQAESTRAQLSVGHRVMSDRLGRVREWVLPFLRAVATGGLDPAEPVVRQQAATLEAAVRDDIRLGPAIDGNARDAHRPGAIRRPSGGDQRGAGTDRGAAARAGVPAADRRPRPGRAAGAHRPDHVRGRRGCRAEPVRRAAGGRGAACRRRRAGRRHRGRRPFRAGPADGEGVAAGRAHGRTSQRTG